MTHLLEVSKKENDKLTIEIFSEANSNPIFIIDYNPENQLTSMKVLKQDTDFERCFDNCIAETLDSIANEGSFIRRARFIIFCAVEFAWILGDCSVYCFFYE